MRGTEPLQLTRDGSFWKYACGFLRDRIVIRPDHHDAILRAGLCDRAQHMRDQRFVSDLMQHLRQRGPHARALARRQHHRKTCPLGHSTPFLGFRPAS